MILLLKRLFSIFFFFFFFGGGGLFSEVLGLYRARPAGVLFFSDQARKGENLFVWQNNTIPRLIVDPGKGMLTGQNEAISQYHAISHHTGGNGPVSL